jgi:predicted nucleic acid-binding Zn ribbon protein
LFPAKTVQTSLRRCTIITRTTGAPNTAVTVLMLNSVGANNILANKSQKRQKTAPPRKQAGIITIDRVVPNKYFTSCGTAIPTKETGPANAVTQAESKLENTTKATRSQRMFTPRFRA